MLAIAEGVVADRAEREGEVRADLDPADAWTVLQAWLTSVGLGAEPLELIAFMQADGFSHKELARRARRAHEQALSRAVAGIEEAVVAGSGYKEAAMGLFEACVPAVPYAPATAILGAEVLRLARRDSEPRRVALVVDGTGWMHGVTHTIERIREHGVPGWEVEVIGTDARVDRRLPSAAEVEIPFYPGTSIGVPTVPELVETLVEVPYDLVHLVSPGPAGIGAALTARVAGIPLIGSYHTELAAYAGLRSSDPRSELAMRAILSAFYGQCEAVLSPSPAADASLAGLGVDEERVRRWSRGVDSSLYGPHRRDPGVYPGEVKVLYAGRLTTEKGVDLLAESFLLARERDPRLHLLLAGGGPEEQLLRVRLGEHATFLGWLDREELATAYASSDLFLFCSSTDTYGQVIVEAQASGLAVVAVNEGGPASLIRDRITGWLCGPNPAELAAGVAQLAASPFLRERIASAALSEAGGRTWEGALAELGAGYDRAFAASVRKREPRALSEVA